MEGNSITSFENLCKIFEMRIKLDKEKGVKTSLDILNNYEKYSKKIDAVYNSEFQKELKSLISPGITLEKEEERLRKLIKLLEERLDRRGELEDRFYNTTGKYISGLQVIVSESELLEKKNRLSIITNYLETTGEIDSVEDSLSKLRVSLEEEENKRIKYEEKNKIMEDELYSSFIRIVREDDYYRDINEDELDSRIDEIRSKVSETKETLDITRESVGSLVNNGLEDDYSSYIEEAEKNYYNYKNKEIILKIYKLVVNFEEDFKLMCSKREKINKLIDEKKGLKEDLTISVDDDLLSFEKILLVQVKTLDEEREVLENIINYNSRIKFKEERLEELNEINSSSDTLAILSEYGLVNTYNNDIEVLNEDVLNDIDVLDMSDEGDSSIAQKVYDPYSIVEVKDYPKSLNVELAKLKGESVREKVNKKLSIKDDQTSHIIEVPDKEETVPINDNVLDSTHVDENEDQDNSNLTIETDNIPFWTISTITDPKSVGLEDSTVDLPIWENVKPNFDEQTVSDKNNEMDTIDITSGSDSSNMFWIPVSDSKLETQDFPNLNFTTSNFNNNNFDFPNMNN